MTYALSGGGFFVFTIILQYCLFKSRKNHNRGKHKIWSGPKCAGIICVIGIFEKNPVYFAAVIGYLLADEIGKTSGWHD